MQENSRFESVAKVYKTDDYSVFKYLLGNRQVSSQRVKKIIKSIENVGYIEPSPVVVNEKMEVIDGQGRIEACKQKGLPVYFVIVKNAGIKECQSMNIGQANWNTGDYILSYASMGNQNYVRLLKILKEYTNLTALETYGICTNTITIGGYCTIVIKSGDFKLSEEKYKEVLPIFDYLREIEKVIKLIPGSGRLKRTAIAWVVANTSCDRERLRERLYAEYPILSPVIDTAPTLFLSELSDLYNKRLSKSKCLYFDAMYKQFLR